MSGQGKYLQIFERSAPNGLAHPNQHGIGMFYRYEKLFYQLDSQNDNGMFVNQGVDQRLFQYNNKKSSIGIVKRL